MAYNIPNGLRNKMYSGGAIYTAKLSIGGKTIDPHSIKSIERSDSVIDSKSKNMYIGTFVGNQFKISFKNGLNVDLTGKVHLEIGIKENESDNFTYVPMGYFNIETSPEDYYKNTNIVVLDDSTKFKMPVDISQFFTTPDEGQPYITLEDLLIDLCDYYGVDLGTYPDVNKDLRIYSYDSTVSGKQYISWIAELMAGNAKIGRDGRLYIIPAKQPSACTINALACKSFSKSEEYHITRVVYDNLMKSEFGSDDGNTLVIRGDNMFVGGTQEELDTVVGNVYEAIKDLRIWSINVENYGDISLDSTDIVTYHFNDTNTDYTTYYSGTLTYEQTVMSKVSVTIPTKQVQETTNVIPSDTDTKIRNLSIKIDRENNLIRQEVTEIDNDLSSRMSSTEQTVDGFKQEVNQEISYLEQSIEIFRVDMDSNVIIVSVDINNYPIQDGVYTINYNSYFKNNKVSIVPTVEGSHAGITTSINNIGITFNVNTSTQIPALDNSYILTFKYIDTNDNDKEYTINRKITVSLVQSGKDAEESIIQSNTAPNDKTVMWMDTANNQLKRWNGDEWEIVNDFSTDIDSIIGTVNNLDQSVQQQFSDMNGVIEQLRQTTSTQYEQTNTSFNFQFNTLIENLKQLQDEVDSDKKETIKYIRFEDGVIKIGIIGNDFELRISNDEIQMLYNGNKYSWWKQDLFTANKLDARMLILGNFAFMPRDNGSLDFGKVE